jgi:VanZ family protein
LGPSHLTDDWLQVTAGPGFLPFPDLCYLKIGIGTVSAVFALQLPLAVVWWWISPPPSADSAASVVGAKPQQLAQMTISKNPLSTQVFVLRCLGWISVATIAILSLVPVSERPHVLAAGQLEHFVAYAGTAAFLATGYAAKRQLIGISVLLPICAAGLEILQTFVPGRNARMIDAAAGTIGSWVGIVLGLSVHYWCRNR